MKERSRWKNVLHIVATVLFYVGGFIGIVLLSNTKYFNPPYEVVSAERNYIILKWKQGYSKSDTSIVYYAPGKQQAARN